MLSVQDTGPGLAGGPAAAVAGALATATAETLANEPAPSAPSVEPLPSAPPPPAVASGPGEGIGLAIVKRLCDRLDATLEVHTEAGRGAVVGVILPRT